MPTTRSRLFSWLAAWCDDELRGTLVDIFVADRAGAAMRRVRAVEALAGRGLAGDRYSTGEGHWKHTDACQVTLVTEEDIARAQKRGGISFASGEHRRNLVVRGIPREAYRGRRVRIGETLFEYHRLRPPCGYLDRLVGRGAGKALGRGAGIGLRVIEGGWIEAGANVEILPKTGERTRSAT